MRPSALIRALKEGVDDATRDIASATWSILKTILFTTLMLSQSVLSAVVFVPNLHDSPGSTMSPYAIALEILHTLSHLSFIMPQFGGVASTSEGLPELKRAFYMALDVLSESQEEACRFVEELHCVDGASGKGKGTQVVIEFNEKLAHAFYRGGYTSRDAPPRKASLYISLRRTAGVSLA